MKVRISFIAHALGDVALERHNCSGVLAAKIGVAHVVETYRVP